MKKRVLIWLLAALRKLLKENFDETVDAAQAKLNEAIDEYQKKISEKL